jgi:CMP/dCMP kinase
MGRVFWLPSRSPEQSPATGLDIIANCNLEIGLRLAARPQLSCRRTGSCEPMLGGKIGPQHFTNTRTDYSGFPAAPLPSYTRPMIVTIDGPAGAGKSSAARELARRLGYRFLDTGAMYRAVTLAAKERGLDLGDSERLTQLVGEIQVDLDGEHVLLDGRDVTKEIRTFEITTSIQYAADNPAVRDQLVVWQRAAADGRNVVTEGRDQGTVVFPHAECKIFLTADEDERARRRYLDLVSRGEQVTFDEVLDAQHVRDESDRNRSVGALRIAEDAIEVSTNGLSPAEVVTRLEEIVRSRQ